MNILFLSTNSNFKLPVIKSSRQLVNYKTSNINDTISLIETTVFSIIFIDANNYKTKLSNTIKKITYSSPYSKLAVLNFSHSKDEILKLTQIGVDFILDKKWTSKNLKEIISSSKIYLNFNEKGVPYIFSDDLTSLYNRRLLNYRLDALIKYNDQSFAVLFIDIDNFKSVNEKYGHLVASRTLAYLGDFLYSFGSSDTSLFRYGGDEFVFILTRTCSKIALEFAERIRQYTEKKVFLVDDKYKINVTLSIGIAMYPNDAKTSRDILDMADRAMFVSKKNNKNMIYLAENCLKKECLHR